MTACAKCGHDPGAAVARTWRLVIAKELESANKHTINSGGARWRYAKERGEWEQWLMTFPRGDLHRATGRRRVTITRRFSGRQREWDPDNLVAGTKVLRDALKRAGVIVDDSRQWLECHSLQERADRSETVVLVEELA